MRRASGLLSTVELRPAAPPDVPKLAAIFLRCWRGAYRGIVSDATIGGLDPEQIEALWGGLVRTPPPGQTVIVASVSGSETPVGMIRIGPDEEDERRGHVFSLYVDPGSSRAGVGRALLERGMADLRAAGYRTATLWVFEGNEPALRLYRAAGWQTDGVRRVEREYDTPEIRLAVDLRGTSLRHVSVRRR